MASEAVRKWKVGAVEWCLLKWVYPLQALCGGGQSAEWSAPTGARTVLLTLVPRHGNMGDHAIAFATRVFLRDCLPEWRVIEVDIRDIYRHARALRRILNDDDVVLLLGGGNTGDLYRNEEWTRRFVVRTFTRQRIVSLPQTAHFTNTRRGERELTVTGSVLGAHPRLMFVAREQATLNFVRRKMPGVRTDLYPDMVLYLDESRPVSLRDGIAACLRSDRESALSDGDRAALLDALRTHAGNCELFDTIAPRSLNPSTREGDLRRLWGYLRTKKVVVTDRLHGMVFCYITRTPCVVIRSFDHKVSETYRTIANRQNFIFLVDSPTVDEVIRSVCLAERVGVAQADDLRDTDFRRLAGAIRGVS